MSAAAVTTTPAYIADLQLGAELASGPRAGGKVTRLEISAAGVVSVYTDGDTKRPWRIKANETVEVVRPFSAPTRAAIVGLELLEREINALAAAERERDEMLALPTGEVADSKIPCIYCDRPIGNVGALANHMRAKHPDR